MGQSIANSVPEGDERQSGRDRHWIVADARTDVVQGRPERRTHGQPVVKVDHELCCGGVIDRHDAGQEAGGAEWDESGHRTEELVTADRGGDTGLAAGQHDAPRSPTEPAEVVHGQWAVVEGYRR